jgi:hypothetical protein
MLAVLLSVSWNIDWKLPNNLLMSDEAHFDLHHTVCKHNFWYWSAASPHELYHRPLYDLYTIWCAGWSGGVTGPYIFESEDEQTFAVTSQHFTKIINELIAAKLPPDHNSWFQQDGVTFHTTVISVAALCHLLPRRWFLISVMCHSLVHWA